MSRVLLQEIGWAISVATHPEVEQVIWGARVEARIPPHLCIQAVLLGLDRFLHLLDQPFDAWIALPLGLLGHLFGHDQLHVRIIEPKAMGLHQSPTHRFDQALGDLGSQIAQVIERGAAGGPTGRGEQALEAIVGQVQSELAVDDLGGHRRVVTPFLS
jgi:hypothetical protein